MKQFAFSGRDDIDRDFSGEYVNAIQKIQCFDSDRITVMISFFAIILDRFPTKKAGMGSVIISGSRGKIRKRTLNLLRRIIPSSVLGYLQGFL